MFEDIVKENKRKKKHLNDVKKIAKAVSRNPDEVVFNDLGNSRTLVIRHDSGRVYINGIRCRDAKRAGNYLKWWLRSMGYAD